ncbi:MULTISPECIES: dienelactone hydrolase family protein [Thermomonospora]|uniref:Dienelactone hydrolase n=1 Tax=Thermomonospora curvata (strain ATCC 19995 / DSM 43183 / JCM 3096 / KCTC 9072 / NBRC 15933 / NCIMB 10081 / Henssen B9) TaxID=471852 RepID=D1ACM8_THECD|nr:MULTISPECIES: dienelactone hydrolase family protein [Thermomonospora]ACY97367.1 dienelactone hydrolase [Thermomonospora curvata DSM 43183]PKK14726.1 MAG: alpha/beta hydrolase [Thermomonospora sp. CIF 1]
MTTLRIPAGTASLEGDLVEPPGGRAVVVFAHGSGSSRHSPRNRRVAAFLNEQGFGTLLFDLLTPEEGEMDARTARLRFDIGLLAGRLGRVVAWLRAGPAPPSVGLFGASTGAAAALVAAARRPGDVAAVVSRGGRPDLAGPDLAEVRSPTLFVVGGQDRQVLALNEQALEAMGGPAAGHRLVVVPGAGHLFEEPGALEEVGRLTAQWFREHLSE